MKKALVFMIVSLFVVTSVFAETPTGMAVGYDGGLSLRYLAGSIGVQGILGLEFDSPAAEGADSAIDLNIGVNVFTCLWECDRGNLNGIAGVGIDMDGSSIKDSDAVTNISLMAGLEPEVFLLDNLSVTTKFGVQIMIQGDERETNMASPDYGKAKTDSGSLMLGTFGENVSIVSGAAFNWYF